jgi:hypothetical protein
MTTHSIMTFGKIGVQMFKDHFGPSTQFDNGGFNQCLVGTHLVGKNN